MMGLYMGELLENVGEQRVGGSGLAPATFDAGPDAICYTSSMSTRVQPLSVSEKATRTTSLVS